MNTVELTGVKFLTGQEHALMASSERGRSFYTPIILDEGLPIDAVNGIRQHYKKFLVIRSFFVDSEGRRLGTKENPYIELELAPLNPRTGETIHDPMAVDKKYRINPELKERFGWRA